MAPVAITPPGSTSIETISSETLFRVTSDLKKVTKVQGYHNDGTKTPKQLIGQALRKRVESVDHDNCDTGDEDAFFVADLGEVFRQHLRWKMNLKRVKPFYGKSDSCAVHAISF